MQPKFFRDTLYLKNPRRFGNLQPTPRQSASAQPMQRWREQGRSQAANSSWRTYPRRVLAVCLVKAC